MPTAICENCVLVFDDSLITTCPTCDSHSYDYPDENLLYCPNKTCFYFLKGQDTTSPHCSYCSTDSKKIRLLSAEDLTSLIVVPEKTLTKADRQLKVLIQEAENFINGSGTHHRSKGGSHTSSASEKHSSAMGSKKQVRDKYVVRLQEAIENAEEKSLKAEAVKTIEKMKNK